MSPDPATPPHLPAEREPREGEDEPFRPVGLPMANPLSAGAGHEPAFVPEEVTIPPRHVERGVVVFDLDGTILDDLKLIAHVAGDVLHGSFGTPPEEARIHYLATTGMPFEAQLAQLYPDAPLALRLQAARTFHERKVREAYAYARPFAEVPRLLKRLEAEHWTLAISTGAEREVAELLLEREGLRIWFEAVLGSGQGTKREHLAEYRRRYPDAPLFLVGDSRFDLESAQDEGVPMLARAALYPDWTVTPQDFQSWGAAWSDYTLAALPEVLARLLAPPRTPAAARPSRPDRTSRSRRSRSRSPSAGRTSKRPLGRAGTETLR